MRIIWCGGRLFYTINLAQLLIDFFIKVFTLVTAYLRWDSIRIKPLIHKALAMVFTCWFGVTTATLNFPSLLRSTFMKLYIIDPRVWQLLTTVMDLDQHKDPWQVDTTYNFSPNL